MADGMAGSPRISNAEWEIMNVVWERETVSSSEAVDALAEPNDWHEQTVKTLLARLVKKGVLSAEPQGRRYLYRPAVSRQECIREEGRSFLDRVFDGQVDQLLTHFARSAHLTPDQADQLKRILDENSGEMS